MAARKFSSQLLSPNQDNIIMTGGNYKDSTVVVNFCNQNNFPVNIWLAYSDNTGQYTNSDYLLFQYPIAPYIPFQFKGIAVETLCSLIARTDSVNVSVIVYGVDDTNNS